MQRTKSKKNPGKVNKTFSDKIYYRITVVESKYMDTQKYTDTQTVH